MAVAGLICFISLPAWAGITKANAEARASAEKEKDDPKRFEVRVVKDQDETAAPVKDRTWLGVGIEEASESLAEQLGLDSGVGLLVTHVSADSPAAKAGLKKNDVLIEMSGQSLVHPAQLRKLVQARKAGDKVKLVFYRGGKKQTETATLETAPARLGLFDGDRDESLGQLQLDLKEIPHAAAFHVSKAVSEAMRNINGPQRLEIQAEIERGMAQARKAIEEAARQLGRDKDSLHKEGLRLKELIKSGISVDDNATVVVRSKGKSSRSLVKTDEAGTIILVGPPNLRLSVTDKEGKVLFDGEIETAEQRAKVPAEVWKRVEPLLEEKPALEKADEPKKKED